MAFVVVTAMRKKDGSPDMGIIVRAENNAGPETVEPLIAGKRLMSGIVDEDQKIVGVRFQFLVYRLH
jgi:hypothetical protein